MVQVDGGEAAKASIGDVTIAVGEVVRRAVIDGPGGRLAFGTKASWRGVVEVYFVHFCNCAVEPICVSCVLD